MMVNAEEKDAIRHVWSGAGTVIVEDDACASQVK